MKMHDLQYKNIFFYNMGNTNLLADYSIILASDVYVLKHVKVLRSVFW